MSGSAWVRLAVVCALGLGAGTTGCGDDSTGGSPDGGGAGTDGGGGGTDGGGGGTDGGGGGTDGGTTEGPVGVVFSTGNGVGVAAADGTGARMLDEAGASGHVVSPDGTQIAYRGEGGYLYVVPVSGGSRTQVSTNTVAGGYGYSEPLYFGWSADGSRLWYLQSYTVGNVVAPDGSDEVEVPGEPMLSPDGSQVAYVAQESETSDRLWIMPSDGSADPVEISGAGSGGATPEVSSIAGWSPDGARIAYLEDRDGAGTQMYLVDPDGANDVQITTTGGGYSDVAWADDGSFIVYVDGGDVYRANADGSGITMLASSGYYPVLSPTGAMVSFNGGGLSVVAADGSAAPIAVAPDFDPPSSTDRSWERGYVWAPDDSRLLYRGDFGSSELHGVLADGSGDVQIYEGSPSIGAFGFVDADTIVWNATVGSGPEASRELFIGAADGTGDPLHSSYGEGSARMVDIAADGESLCEMQLFSSGGIGGSVTVTIHVWTRAADTWNGVEVVSGHDSSSYDMCTILE